MKNESIKKKRKRKKKDEINRNFVCKIEYCDKSYGSENSLNQHIKLKHKEFWDNLKTKEINVNTEETIFFKKNNHFLEKVEKEKIFQEEENKNLDFGSLG